jgi:hypothetical protein
MPVILAPENYELWLDASMQYENRALAMLKPFEPTLMKRHPVSTRVTKSRMTMRNALHALNYRSRCPRYSANPLVALSGRRREHQYCGTLGYATSRFLAEKAHPFCLQCHRSVPPKRGIAVAVLKDGTLVGYVHQFMCRQRWEEKHSGNEYRAVPDLDR